MASNLTLKEELLAKKEDFVKSRYKFEAGQCYVNTDTFSPLICVYEILFVTDREPGRTLVIYSALELNDDSEEMVEMDDDFCLELNQATQISKEDYLRYRIDPSGKWKKKN